MQFYDVMVQWEGRNENGAYDENRFCFCEKCYAEFEHEEGHLIHYHAEKPAQRDYETQQKRCEYCGALFVD